MRVDVHIPAAFFAFFPFICVSKFTNNKKNSHFNAIDMQYKHIKTISSHMDTKTCERIIFGSCTFFRCSSFFLSLSSSAFHSYDYFGLVQNF